MRRSIFGWSYPPGCSGPPDEEPICVICNGNVDANECVCHECPVCGSYGDPYCYEHHGMVQTFKQIKQSMYFEMLWEEEAKGEAKYWEQLYKEEKEIIL